ncbi:MAG: LytR family transcriptional regulator [Actinobacteria bacterium]|nr:LytR family transcriptional regulator [Actinomycetota bacterium]
MTSLPRSSGGPARAFAGRFLIAVVVGALLMGAAVIGVNEEVGRKLDRIPKIELTTAPVPPGGANYLVVGSDSREFVASDLAATAFGDSAVETGRRSDTIMLVHVEPKAQRTMVVSFPRDLWVNIPGRGMNKINAAYNEGPQLLIDTLKQNFDVDVNHYIEIDFMSFIDLVDSLGRVAVYLPYQARDAYTGLDIATPGCVELDGERSLQYVRSRYLEFANPGIARWIPADVIPDLGRIGRQQEFLRRLAGLAVQKSLANPFTANVVADRVVKGLKVDDGFDRTSVFSLLDAFRTLNPDDQSALEMFTVPTRGGPSPGGLSVLYADTANPLFGQIVERLRTFERTPAPLPAPAEIRVRVVNASGREGLEVAVTKELRNLGFVTVDPVESADRIASIDVRVSREQTAKGKRVLRFIEPAAQLTVTEPSDVDVTLVLGRAFAAIAVPADAAADPGTPAEPPAAAEPEAPLGVTPPAALPANLPAPAPRIGC